MFHGGLLDEPGDTFWFSADADYASAFAELRHGDFVWSVTLDLDDADVLDLTSFSYRAKAVMAALRRAGITAPSQIAITITSHRPRSVASRRVRFATRAIAPSRCVT